jgi:hypothetical protein
LNPYRGVHRGERDRDRDDGAHQLTRAQHRCLEGRLAFVDMALHVLHHHDRIVHHQAHREHDGEQRQQVDREPRHEHQEDGANE